MLGHRSLSKFKTIDIISSTFSDDNTMRLDINYKERLPKKKTPQTHGGSIMLLNNQWITEEVKEKKKKNT